MSIWKKNNGVHEANVGKTKGIIYSDYSWKLIVTIDGVHECTLRDFSLTNLKEKFEKRFAKIKANKVVSDEVTVYTRGKKFAIVVGDLLYNVFDSTGKKTRFFKEEEVNKFLLEFFNGIG